MTTLHAGSILQSSPAMDDDHFRNTVVLVAGLSAQGAIGFVTNRLFSRKLNELTEFSNGAPFPLYLGGPVNRESLYFIHRRPDLVQGGQLIDKNVYLGGYFKQAVEAISNGSLQVGDIKIFIGYCGWDAGELEAELHEGSWQLAAGDAIAALL